MNRMGPREVLRKLAEAIRAKTTYWRHDHVGAFIKSMTARGWIMPTAGGFFTWGPRAEDWKPKPATEVVKADLPAAERVLGREAEE